MYIDLNVEVLKQLTFPQSAEEICGDTPIHKNMDSSPLDEGTPVQKNIERVSRNKETAPNEFMETNTETISKNNTKISHKNTQSINPPACAEQDTVSMDGLSEDELREIVEDDFFRDKSIPYHYRSDGRMLVAIKTLTDWYELTPKHFTSGRLSSCTHGEHKRSCPNAPLRL